ncbi:MAG: hypothetical protein C4334_02905 [Pyrinomonas sp.]|uniref:PilZ domain-containing protein n=1 Tax=Pyrinomonas sp. TaxID=2080306 RepID=UPI00331B51EB
MKIMGANLPQDERRRHDRARLIIDLYFEGHEGTGIANTRDIGVGGLYMNTQTVLPEGTMLTLRLPLGEEPLIIRGRVVYSNPGRGVGVEFDGLTDEQRARLEEAIRRASSRD